MYHTYMRISVSIKKDLLDRAKGHLDGRPLSPLLSKLLTYYLKGATYWPDLEPNLTAQANITLADSHPLPNDYSVLLDDGVTREPLD